MENEHDSYLFIYENFTITIQIIGLINDDYFMLINILL